MSGRNYPKRELPSPKNPLSFVGRLEPANWQPRGVCSSPILSNHPHRIRKDHSLEKFQVAYYPSRKEITTRRSRCTLANTRTQLSAAQLDGKLKRLVQLGKWGLLSHQYYQEGPNAPLREEERWLVLFGSCTLSQKTWWSLVCVSSEFQIRSICSVSGLLYWPELGSVQKQNTL